MTSIEIIVLGAPAPQGSKRHVGHGVMVESSAKVKPWRMAVKYAAMDAMRDGDTRVTVGAVDSYNAMHGAIILEVIFRLARPKGHYGTGCNVGRLKPGQPWRPNVRPDIDKLLRSTFDALGEAGVWGDDAQVVSARASKVYADVGLPGATIKVTSLGNTIAEQVA